ncbi:hypothetical protein N7470_001138 [Penicillium chermesinum]|nr:hypothetical protein N7470_001138 [Penicillium chermesinum]
MSALRGTPSHSLDQNWLGKTDIAVQAVLLVVALVTVGLRLWSRRLMCCWIQGNDWFIVAAVIVATGRYVIELLLVLSCGMGLHEADVLSMRGARTIEKFWQVSVNPAEKPLNIS